MTVAFVRAIGIGDGVLPFVIGLDVRPCDEAVAFGCICDIETPPPMNLVECDVDVDVDAGIGLNVILLLTPATGKTFVAGTVTFLGVTVSSLFFVIAVTASLVASLALDVLVCIGFRMIDGIG